MKRIIDIAAILSLVSMSILTYQSFHLDKLNADDFQFILLLSTLLIGVITFFFSSLGFFYFVREAYWSLVSPNWPTTKGKVTKNFIGQTLGTGGVGFPVVCVFFEYTVNEKIYESKRKSFYPRARLWISDKRLEEELAQYPLGKEITIYYAPQKPSTAVICPGITSVFQIPVYILMILSYGVCSVVSLFTAVISILLIRS